MSSKCNNIKLALRNDKSEFVCASCKKCLITANHDLCVFNYVNDMNSRDNNQSVNVSNTTNYKKHKPNVKKSKKLGSKERLASPRPRKPRTCLSESECQSDTYAGDHACASNPQEPTKKRFPNSTFCLGRLWRSSMGEYFVEGLGHNLFSVRQFCDSHLEVAFIRNTFFVRNLEGVDLLKGSRTTNLYTINLYEMTLTSPICLMARATSTKSWLWHQRLSLLNFDTINNLAKNNLVTALPKFKYTKEHLCPLCEQGKSRKVPHKPKHVPNSKNRLHLLHMDLCGPMRVKSINGKRYVLVIGDDYSRHTWVHFLRSKDEAPEEIKTFLKKSQVLLQASTIIDVDELQQQPKHVQQQDNQPQLQSEVVVENIYNAMFDENMFINLFAPASISSDESSSQYVDPSNIHTSCRMLGYLQEYFWQNSIFKRKVHELVIKKARLYSAVNCGGRICVSIRLMCSIPLDVNTGEAKTTSYERLRGRPTAATRKPDDLSYDSHQPEIFYTSVGNPIKDILLKLNIPDHRILKDGGKGRGFNDFPRFVGALIADFAIGSTVNLALKMKGDMIIENLNLNPTIDAIEDILEKVP
ncbi:retrovirus-related pol polyprotein from transposon TNT 1-94 [Tanacetum coccineum]|uniref:Retrovirus-related pol polyprotein from transposon TNT 1-94 n=1 Tax=Tanacetum coccineum TaxID=301880 RepID=A0ABQ5G429_9ASTR